jgi:syntaxin-binding protein 5
LKHRRPDVTAMAAHPCGHFFAVGYADGSIAFWAIEDEDKPLMVLTLDGQHDVNIANAQELDEALSKGHSNSGQREPIFKLAWSGFANSDDPRGGDTVLTVLGGLKGEDVPGITAVLLPAFNPPEPPALAGTSASTSLHPNIRAAMRQSVIPKNFHTYSTVGTPQDFLLLPRESPHFSGSWDPYAILLLSDGEKEARATEAYQFPPPIFGIHKNVESPVVSPKQGSEQVGDTLSDQIASTLESMKLNDDPKSLDTPPAFWSGPIGVTSGDLINLERDSYETLIAGKIPAERLIVRGGAAWIDDDDNQQKLLRVRFNHNFCTHELMFLPFSFKRIDYRQHTTRILQFVSAT